MTKEQERARARRRHERQLKAIAQREADGARRNRVLAIIATVVAVLGGLALIAGFGTRVAALVLAVFTLAATFIFHAYWAVPADMQMVQQLMFFKNMAVVGGLLVLAAHGAGAWSVDAKRQG